MVARDRSKPWIEDEEFFREQREVGQAYQEVVAGKFRSFGMSVTVLDDGFRSSIGQIDLFTRYSSDLLVDGEKVEVKSRSVKFTSPDDWKLWPMIIDTVSSFDEKDQKPLCYVFVSQETEALMGVMTSTMPAWTKHKIYDRSRLITDEFYCVSREHVLDERQLVHRLNADKIVWWISTLSFTAGAVARDGVVVEAAPILRKFKGQPVSNLTDWASKLPGFRYESWPS